MQLHASWKSLERGRFTHVLDFFDLTSFRKNAEAKSIHFAS